MINARGAYCQIDAIEGADVSYSAAVTSNGTARDLTNATLAIIVKDVDDDRSNGRGPARSEETYAQTITDAANGLFTFTIPKEAFSNKEGNTLTWQLVITENAIESSLGYGPIVVAEVL